MKILIAAASFASNMSGLQRHALNVARCLLPEPEISTLHLSHRAVAAQLCASRELPSGWPACDSTLPRWIEILLAGISGTTADFRNWQLNLQSRPGPSVLPHARERRCVQLPDDGDAA